jgi:uncharacterized DUF497 family protein
MDFEWDERKRQSNLAKHGADFQDVSLIDWASVRIRPSTRGNTESRFLAFGPIRGRLYAVVFTKRGAKYRVISFRRASREEVKRYG